MIGREVTYWFVGVTELSGALSKVLGLPVTIDMGGANGVTQVMNRLDLLANTDYLHLLTAYVTVATNRLSVNNNMGIYLMGTLHWRDALRIGVTEGLLPLNREIDLVDYF